MLSSRNVAVIWKSLFPTALYVSLSGVSCSVTLGVSPAQTLTRALPVWDWS